MDHQLITFKLPREVYEKFVELFPARGARSEFLRCAIRSALQHAKEKDCFVRFVDKDLVELFFSEKEE